MSNLPLELASHLVFIKDQIEWCEGCVIDRDKNNNPICVRDYVNLDNAKEWLNMFIQIEQELGCPLDVVLNLIKNTNTLDKESRTEDIYFDYKGRLIEASFLSLSFEHNQFVFLVQTSLPDSIYDYESMTLNVKDYGKTWCLKGV